MKHRIFTLLMACLAGMQVWAQRVTVTVAGTGNIGFSGDGAAARKAFLNKPADVCTDAANNLYFIDQLNNRIRKISAVDGRISTIAGGGVSTADGVAASMANLESPRYMCIDAAGNIYYTAYHRIRKIAAGTGIVTTVAGSTTPGLSGDGGPASAAQLYAPEGICIDATGNLFVADRRNNRVRKISSTGIITTIAGTGAAGYTGDGGLATAAMLNHPICICVNADGVVFFSDQSPYFPGVQATRIRKIEGGNIATIAGTASMTDPVSGVPPLNATLGAISGMCISKVTGNLICTEISCCCREIDFSTNMLNLLGGNFYIQAFSDDREGPLANMNYPFGICVDGEDNVYVADSENDRIRKIIKLTTQPRFAFGHVQYLAASSGPNAIDSLLWMTDVDSGQVETWSVVTAPLHGTLGSLPATAVCWGKHRTTKPLGLDYTPASETVVPDLFRIRVTDGETSDTITVYVGSASTPPTTGVANVVTAGINIYPNPATTELNISGTEKITSISIIDYMGHVVAQEVYNDTHVTQNIANLATGYYLIKINGVVIKQFLKK